MGTRNIYRYIVEQVPDGVYIISREDFSYVNEAFEKLTGVSRKDLPAPIIDFLDTIHPADREVLRERRETAKTGGKLRARFQIRVISEDGTVRHLEFNTALVSGLPHTVIGIVRDITEAKTREAARKRQERHFRAVIEAAEEPMAIIQDSIIRYVNPALAKLSGFSRKRLAGKPFQDFIAPDESKRVEDYDIRRKTGKSAPFFYETVGKNKKGQRLNIQVSISQISYHGKSAFLVVAQDVTKYKQAESELSGALEKVRVALGATVQTIIEIVKQRDPYTAGHQRRVADLGVAIASELEYPADQIEGIRMAGLLHDLGKISIPAEILTKPQKLSEAEYDLIKAHPKTAYDILRKIVFPWPVADIIHQHHERMNGSGYPQGLKDGEIVAEARILAVADVVEAMITHRPYREARKLEEAIQEISSKKGILYDPEVVDACMRALLEKGFSFRSAPPKIDAAG